MSVNMQIFKKRIVNFSKKKYALYLYVGIFAIVTFCSIYGINVLNPTYTDWLFAADDISQHYLGWKAYRNSAWSFPIGMLNTLAYPSETSIIFTDSIPMYAVFFKLFAFLLPTDFQYFGLWGVMCFVIQALFTAKIINKYADSRMVTFLSSILLTLTPVMIWRMYAHTALAGQWVILYGLEPLYNHEKYDDSTKRMLMHICIMGILSPSIHMYFVLMNGIVLVGICLFDIMKKRFKRAALSLLVYLASVAVIVALLGGFSSGIQADSSGLGLFAFNLNALFNPQGWSCIFQTLPLYRGEQYEGFAYLGGGCILALLLSCLVLVGKTDGKNVIKRSWEKIAALTTVAILAMIVALSPVITINDICLKELELPNKIIQLWSIFRSSGRIIWVTIYIIILCSLGIICKFCVKRMATVILFACLLLQIYDIHEELGRRHEKFAQRVTYDSRLKDTEFWDSIAENPEIKHIVFTNLSLDRASMFSFTNWVTDCNKTVNTFFFPRTIDSIRQNLDDAYDNLSRENLYIFFDSNKLDCVEHALHYYFIDNYIVGYVNPIEGYEEFDVHDLTLTWTFGNNKYLDGGLDNENERTLYPNGLSYGPYWQVPAGKWRITISGEGLEKTDVFVYSQYGQLYHEFEIEKSNNQISVLLFLPDASSNLETVVRNTSDQNIQLTQMDIRKEE